MQTDSRVAEGFDSFSLPLSHVVLGILPLNPQSAIKGKRYSQHLSLSLSV